MTTDNTYFETLGRDNGYNPVKNNPCQLLDFGLLKLAPGQSWEGQAGDNEVMALILGGKCNIEVNGQTFENLGQRPNVFAGKPYAVYIPTTSRYSISARGAVEIGLCQSQAKSDTPTLALFVVKPS